jgi:soluble lytic murein transglycosylase
VLALLATLVAVPAAAQIKTRVAADGTLEVYNEGPGLGNGKAQTLRPVPKPSWDAWIRDQASLHGVDPRLVQAVMQAESGYDPRAVSRKGAIGLMQLMPQTARQLAVTEPFSPEQNIRGGVAYLRKMLDRFGSVELAIAAYNAGPGAVERYRGVPPYAETRAYVQRVLGLYRGYGATVVVGLAAAAGPSRPHGLLQTSSSSSALQQALAERAALAARALPRAVPAPTAPQAAGIALAAAASPGPAPRSAPAQPSRPRTAPAVAERSVATPAAAPALAATGTVLAGGG